VVYSGDGDLSAIGGNHLIHAARRNIDLKGDLRQQSDLRDDRRPDGPTTPGHAITSTNPYGTFEPSFNLPHLVEAAGAVYVARWTTFHVRQLARSIGRKRSNKKGFSFIEVISPCPTLYQRRNKMGDGLDTMKYYKEKSKPAWRADQRSRTHAQWRNRGRKVCGPRPSRLHPYVTQPDIMVVMSQEAYSRFAHDLKPGGTLIVEEDLVRVSHLNGEPQDLQHSGYAHRRRTLGKRMVLNSVMVGFFTAVTNLLTEDAVRQAVADSVPAASCDLNLKAFAEGFEYGHHALAGTPAKPELEALAYSEE
jgi:hypothetical protein